MNQEQLFFRRPVSGERSLFKWKSVFDREAQSLFASSNAFSLEGPDALLVLARTISSYVIVEVAETS